jgi:hypothetical protein
MVMVPVCGTWGFPGTGLDGPAGIGGVEGLPPVWVKAECSPNTQKRVENRHSFHNDLDIVFTFSANLAMIEKKRMIRSQISFGRDSTGDTDRE